MFIFSSDIEQQKRVISCNVDRELKVKSNIFLYGGIKHCTDTQILLTNCERSLVLLVTSLKRQHSLLSEINNFVVILYSPSCWSAYLYSQFLFVCTRSCNFVLLKPLTLNLPTTTIVAQPFNIIKWQVKFNPVA